MNDGTDLSDINATLQDIEIVNGNILDMLEEIKELLKPSYKPDVSFDEWQKKMHSKGD